ncbi:hypothetical protein F5Y13DRAFT_194153 [Hypoxylon sp. FL1857]|nr:hypothetical protein F5Y13DRAFT_194153 [Hypoxylon sp. FL1857]
MASAAVTITNTMVEPQGQSLYAWNSCEGSEGKRRILIKEKAFEVGLRHSEQLLDEFRRFLGSASRYSRYTSGSIALGQSLSNRHKKFSVLVGVAGPTGSGKTSALNALIGFNELLPTNNQEAATAVPCKIAYNDDDRDDYKFQANITFRDKGGLIKQLDQFIEDLKARNALEAELSETEEDYDALRVANSVIKPTLELITAVFGFDESELEGMTTQSLLASNRAVCNVLGTTKKLNSGDPDEFSEMIRPYMDSSSANHDEEGSEFSAWPLIDEVEILVKSDILRNGVVLVDLPGLADSIESRAAVAERYFPKLAATLIVSPACRAADDTTAVKLISSHQELRMKLDGKFHADAFCVVLSKTDDITKESEFRKKWAKSSSELQGLLKQRKSLESQVQKSRKELYNAEKVLSKRIASYRTIEKKVSKLRKSINGVDKKDIPATESDRARAMGMRSEAMASVKEHKGAFRALEKEIHDIDGHIEFLCVRERNRSLTERIRQDFQKRQIRMASKHQGQLKAVYDSQISVFPISSTAYWKPLSAFPSRQYSGFPSLAEWIRHSTFREREDHVNGLLHDLHSLYNVIQAWSNKEWSQSSLAIDRAWVEIALTPSIYEPMKKCLNCSWLKLNKSVQKKNPLRDRGASLNDWAKGCTSIAQGWSYKNHDKASKVKQHWLTYQANIQRMGGKFVGKGGQKHIEYHWMEDISDVFLETIVEDWNEALNHDIPGLWEPASKDVDTTWEDFLKRLRIIVEKHLPQLVSFLDSIVPGFEAIKERIKDKVQLALSAISKNASHVHPNLVATIQKRWEPTFIAALKEKGTGSFARRQDIISRFASKSGPKMHKDAFDSLSNELEVKLNEFPDELGSITVLAIDEVRAYINALLDNILQPEVKVEEALDHKRALQQYVRNTLVQWDLEWRVPTQDLSMSIEDARIPNEYLKNHDSDFDGAEYIMGFDAENSS